MIQLCELPDDQRRPRRFGMTINREDALPEIQPPFIGYFESQSFQVSKPQMKRAPTTNLNTCDSKTSRRNYDDVPARHLQLVEEQTAEVEPEKIVLETRIVINETTKLPICICPRNVWWEKGEDGLWTRVLDSFRPPKDFRDGVIVYSTLLLGKAFGKNHLATVRSKLMNRAKGLRCDDQKFLWDGFGEKASSHLFAYIPPIGQFEIDDPYSTTERQRQYLKRWKEDKKVEEFERRMKSGGHAILKDKFIKKTRQNESTQDGAFLACFNPLWLEGKFYTNAVLTTRAIAQMFDLSRPSEDPMNEALLVLDAHHYHLEWEEMKHKDTVKFKATHDKYVETLEEILFTCYGLDIDFFFFFLELKLYRSLTKL